MRCQRVSSLGGSWLRVLVLGLPANPIPSFAGCEDWYSAAGLPLSWMKKPAQGGLGQAVRPATSAAAIAAVESFIGRLRRTWQHAR